MRRLLVALGLMGLLSPAFAADYELPILRGSVPTLPVSSTPTSYVVGPPNPPYHWGGVYGGGQGGYSSSAINFANGVGPLVGNILRSSSLANDVSDWAVLGSSSTASASYGGFVGYNTEWEDVVLGLEVNYNRVSLTSVAKDSITRSFTDNTSAPPNTTYQYDITVTGSSSIHMTDVATFRARAGWDVGQFLPYAFGGLALGRADVAQTASVSGTRTDTIQNPVSGTTITLPPIPVDLPGPQSDAQQGKFAYGFAAGLGMDVALSSNVFARAEWEYVSFAINGMMVNTNTFRGGVGIKF